MSDVEIEKTLNKFLADFNRMCKENNRAVVIREKTVNYEAGPRTYTRRYEVIYKAKKSGSKWKIRAESSGFWIFKKRFPLFNLVRKKDKLVMEGLYVKVLPFSSDELEKQLSDYTEKCKNLARDIFVHF